MGYFRNFWYQKTPKPGHVMPAYYERALIICECILAVYFFIYYFLIWFATGTWQRALVVMFVAMVLCILSNGKINVLASWYAFAIVILFWTVWYVYILGWGSGGQHFMIPLLMFLFFNVYEKPWRKILIFFILLSGRIFLYIHATAYDPAFVIPQSFGFAFQIINSGCVFLTLALCFILFSSNLQETERKLRLDNQELSKKADTDPLTKLPNRRPMMDILAKYQKLHSNENFSLAIADIDHFKSVNDTYGHACGDQTLKEMAYLLSTYAEEEGFQVCRWGGEEFCIFLPEKNLDQAAVALHEVLQAVRRKVIEFEGNKLHMTVTIGVVENDFSSTMEELIAEADEKLYYGKTHGRDQVVL